MAIVKKTKITIDVNLDENNIPEQMQWNLSLQHFLYLKNMA